MKTPKPTTGQEKEVVEIIHTPKDEETRTAKLARLSVIAQNAKEKRFKWHYEDIDPRGRKIVFEKDKNGNLIPKKK